MDSKLFRPKQDRIVAGVCLGLAEYFKIDVVIVRVIFVVLALGNGVGIVAYIILMIVMPEDNGKSYADDIKSSIKDEDKQEIKKQFKSKVEEIKNIANDNRRGTELVAAILIAAGAFFLLNNIAPVFFSYDRIWPLIIVCIGIAILFSDRKRVK